jgi:hypothetical protein
MNFESLYYFLIIKTNGKRLKPRAQYWVGTRAGAKTRGVASCHVRPPERLAGPQPGSPVQLRRRPACPRVVARLRTARWWLAGGKMLPASS